MPQLYKRSPNKKVDTTPYKSEFEQKTDEIRSRLNEMSDAARGDVKAGNRILNREAGYREEEGLPRSTIFDDGAGERKYTEGRGHAFSWPDEMKQHFKLQDNINEFMDRKMNVSEFEEI